MRFSTIGLAVSAGLLAAAPAAAQVTNVAQGATVAATGSFGSSVSVLPSVTDGVFLPEGTSWQSGTVWWMGSPAGVPGTTINVALGGSHEVFGFLLQADNNDAYLVEYRDGSSAGWLTAWLAPTHAVQPGVTTRPGGADRSVIFELATPILASEFRISAAGGDGSYSVSEFQAFSQVSTVPEPGTVVLLATGLAGLGAVTLRRRRLQG